MPSVRRFSAPRPARTPGAPPAVRPAPAVALALGMVLGAGALAGCEYTYDDGRAGNVRGTATAAPEAPFTRDPLQQDPVSEAGLGEWVSRTFPDVPQEVVHADAGLLASGEVRTLSSPVLHTGTYMLALACRSQRRVTFTVRTETLTLVDLGLRCGVNRENVIYLSTDSALSVRLEAHSAANFAFRLRRL